MHILKTAFIVIISLFSFFSVSTDLELLAFEFRVIDLPQFSEFLDRHDDINALDNQGYTLLHKAIFMPHEVAVKLILEQGADLHIPLPVKEFDKKKYPEGKPLIEDLIEKGPTRIPLEIVELLFKYGLDVHISTSKKNPFYPLHLVILKRHQWKDLLYRERWIQFLIDQVNINLQDHDGNTALHIASFEGDVEITRLLVQAGAKTDIKNNEGRTPMQTAQFMSGSLFGLGAPFKWYWYFSFFGQHYRVIQLLQGGNTVKNSALNCKGNIEELSAR